MPARTATRSGGADTPAKALCDVCDRLLAQARSRVWLAIPWLHSRRADGWIGGFVERLVMAKEKGLDVRVITRPEAANKKTIGALKKAGVVVVADTPGARHLHGKVLLTEAAVLVAAFSLTDKDLSRQDVRFVVSEVPERVREFAVALDRLVQSDLPEQEEKPAPAASVLPAQLRPCFHVERLNPMQAAAVPQVLEGKRNLVIASPTGSGKTLVAEVALLREALAGGRAGVYLAPMRAIASEKRDDWRRLEEAGIKVYKSTGEDDAFDPAQALAADIIVSTPEKWDAVSRRSLPAELVGRIGAIVCDEVHLVDDERRGPGLEALLARLHLAFPSARLIAMSGTLLNVEAIGRWLRADVVRSTWRPVRLHMAVVPYPEAGNWRDDEDQRSALAAEIAAATLRQDGAVVVFCGSRKGVEGCAEHLGEALGQKATVASVGNAALRLSLARGVGFHHAGLARADRAVVEGAFRAGTIKVLVATSTVAAGVNLPARVVVVRDLSLGADELGANVLVQMAGRAGRPGLESEGRCYVLAPVGEAARVTEMLEGRPLDSRIGNDIATCLNTEIALGIVRRRDDVRDWYARTFHAHVARQPVDLGAALNDLLQGGFVREESGELAATALGRATSDLMIRVPTARALEGWLAGCQPQQTTANAIEHDLLLAACGLPVEFADLPPVRRAEEEVLARVAERDSRLAGWEDGRLRHLAVAASLLSGLPVAGLPLEGAASLAAAVQTDVPRFLRFLSRRAAEREPGLPEVMAVAADLGTCLEYGLAERGAGAFVDALKLSFRSDESRRRKVLAAYSELRAQGIASLADAAPLLGPRPRRYASAWAGAGCHLLARDGALWAHLGPGPVPARLHLRLVCEGQEVHLTRTGADPREVRLLPLTDLGRRGHRTVGAEAVLTPESMNAPWAYVGGTAEVAVPATPVDLDAADAALRANDVAADNGERTAPASGRLDGDAVLTELRRQAVTPPLAVRRAAAILGANLTRPYDKAEAVVRLLGRREVVAEPALPRPLALVTAAETLTRPEGACLGASLLGAMRVEVDLLRGGGPDGKNTVFCVWKGDGHWYGLPLAPATTSPDGPAVPVWGEPTAGEEPVATAWEVLREYGRLSPRALAFVLDAAVAAPAALERGKKAPGGPRCPQCDGEMRLRNGRFGQFWGCVRYPSCRGTRPA